MKKIEKPEGLTPDASRFWDENCETMQRILETYLHIAQTCDIEAFKMLNGFISVCSQHCVHIMNASAGTPQC